MIHYHNKYIELLKQKKISIHKFTVLVYIL